MQRLPSPDEVRASIAQGELREFVQMAWPIVEGGHAYKPNWHIDAICEHLQAVSDGQLRRLIINIPPRHMKSLAVAVFWPCWHWLREPELQWLFASYAEKLSKRDSLKCRRILESRGGRREDGTLMERVGYVGLLRLLGESWSLASDQNEKLRFENTRTGYRLATSVGGTATGEGGDILVLDDPHKADEVDTETGTQRDAVLDWIDGVMSTRLNDPNTGRKVIVMQRLHEQDATGHLLAGGGYEHLCLPAEYEPSHPFVWPDDPRFEEGELLWPDHFGRGALDELKRELRSAYRVAGQLQQRPAPAEGGLFKRNWWRFYPEGEPPPAKKIWTSWDTALKDKTTGDYTVGIAWLQDLENRYVLRIVRGHWSLVETLAQMKAMHDWITETHGRGGMCAHYVENAAMGPELIAAAKRSVLGVIPVHASTDKRARAEAVTPAIEAGNVFLPAHPVTLQPTSAASELIEECAAFPNSAHDDMVDALVYGIDPRRWTFGAAKRRRDEHQRRPVTASLSARDV